MNNTSIIEAVQTHFYKWLRMNYDNVCLSHTIEKKKLRWLHRHRRLWHYKYVLVTTKNKRIYQPIRPRIYIFANIKNKPNRRLNGFDLVIRKKKLLNSNIVDTAHLVIEKPIQSILRLAYGRQAASINLTTVIKHEKKKWISYFSRTFDLALSHFFSFTSFSLGLSSGKCVRMYFNHYIFITSFEFDDSNPMSNSLNIFQALCKYVYMLTSRVQCMLLFIFFLISFKLTKQRNAMQCYF